ncbi:hypothetical protein [Streptomyces aureus]|uniref:hypothetical protein n=1 Tax=Streptomyces aureus TaxID=193461 RepID=UPI0033FAD259
MTASACGTQGATTAARTVNDAELAALTRATNNTQDLGSAQVTMSTDRGTG